MESIIENLIIIWKIIVESNTFNFLFLILFLIIIFHKAKINNLLNQTIEKIKEKINNSILIKNTSQNDLKLAQIEIEKLPNELKEIEEKNQEIILKNQLLKQ